MIELSTTFGVRSSFLKKGCPHQGSQICHCQKEWPIHLPFPDHDGLAWYLAGKLIILFGRGVRFHLGHGALTLHAGDIYFSCMILVFLTLCNDISHFGYLELIAWLVALCQVQPIPLSVPNFNLELITGLVAFCQVQRPQWIWYNGFWYNGIRYNEFDITK